jgi:hypothetical protein
MKVRHIRLAKYNNGGLELHAKGGITVVETEVGVGVAVCSLKDIYCKQKGRELALARVIPWLPGEEYADRRRLLPKHPSVQTLLRAVSRYRKENPLRPLVFANAYECKQVVPHIWKQDHAGFGVSSIPATIFDTQRLLDMMRTVGMHIPRGF